MSTTLVRCDNQHLYDIHLGFHYIRLYNKTQNIRLHVVSTYLKECLLYYMFRLNYLAQSFIIVFAQTCT